MIDFGKKIREDTEARGYSLTEMNKVETAIKEHRREWIRLFDSYIETLLHYEECPLNKIVESAEKLADARFAKIQEKFGDEIE